MYHPDVAIGHVVVKTESLELVQWRLFSIARARAQEDNGFFHVAVLIASHTPAGDRMTHLLHPCMPPF